MRVTFYDASTAGDPQTGTSAGTEAEGTVLAEVASTPSERREGLMFREDLPPDEGMLFVFASEENHAFWMKNTPLPLDMIFIGRDLRVVGVVAEATPFSTDTRQVGQPSSYVLEVNAGWADEHGVAAGNVVEFDPDPPRAADAP